MDNTQLRCDELTRRAQSEAAEVPLGCSDFLNRIRIRKFGYTSTLGPQACACEQPAKPALGESLCVMHYALCIIKRSSAALKGASMITQDPPRRSLRGCAIPKEKGFWLDGIDYHDCLKQLKEWGAKHPEKWIYFHDCGVGPCYPTPVARHLLEVAIFDAEPAAIMWSWVSFQKGSEGRREIDEMTDRERHELRAKQGAFFAVLGSLAHQE